MDGYLKHSIYDFFTPIALLKVTVMLLGRCALPVDQYGRGSGRTGGSGSVGIAIACLKKGKKMGFLKGTLHYLKLNAAGNKPFTINKHAKERRMEWGKGRGRIRSHRPCNSRCPRCRSFRRSPGSGGCTRSCSRDRARQGC
jgi:superfamily II DNA/RNA helicase